MVSLPTEAHHQYGNAVFDALAHRRRRVSLRVLERTDGVTPAELATRVVAAEGDAQGGTRQERDPEAVRVSLEHAHLPKLEAAGLVTRTDEGVTTTRHPALRDRRLGSIVASDAPDVDDVLDCLADERRRILLATLVRNDAPMDRRALAIAVSETTWNDAEGAASVERVLVDLHHVHIPKLEAAGLVDVDESETVAYRGHRALDDEWLTTVATEDSRTIARK